MQPHTHRERKSSPNARERESIGRQNGIKVPIMLVNRCSIVVVVVVVD